MHLEADTKLHVVRSALLLALAGCGALLGAGEGQAAELGLQCRASYEWSESRQGPFALIYPPAQDSFVKTQIAPHIPTLTEDYERFNRLFDLELQLPIILRVYPDSEALSCLNALLPELGDKPLTHIGTGEIAVVADRARDGSWNWDQQAGNHLRQELGALYVERLTAGEAPRGLVAGVSAYTRNPKQDSIWQQEMAGLGLSADEDWDGLWGDPAIEADPRRVQLSMTTVAYLIDTYGWDSLVEFLAELPTSRGYDEALVDTFQTSKAELERGWRAYVPVYARGRWRAHAIYGFDLSGYESLVAAGVYGGVASELDRVIDLLQDSGQAEALERARLLQEKARAGEKASALARQARQALLDGRYEQAMDLSAQASRTFESIDDSRREQELQAYRQRAQEILELRGEIARMEEGALPAASAQRLADLALRLAELGDERGAESARALLAEQGARRARIAQAVTLLAAALTGGLLWRRLRRLGGVRRPEAEVL